MKTRQVGTVSRWLLVILAVVMLFPFLWMISTALKQSNDLTVYPPQFFPPHPTLQNFGTVFSSLPIGIFFLNSVKISVLGTVGEVLAASLAAYAFARMKFKGKPILYGAFLATMMIPFQVTMIPVFVIIKWLGWIDSQNALIIPHFFGGAFASGAFGIFLLRQFFEQIPIELEDAARIDGTSRWKFFWKIVLPVSKAPLAVLSLFVFMGIWNDLLTPVLFLSSEEKMPLPFGLATLQAAQDTNRFDLLMAGTLISVLPIIILYILAQKWITEAFLRTGVKG